MNIVILLYFIGKYYFLGQIHSHYFVSDIGRLASTTGNGPIELIGDLA